MSTQLFPNGTELSSSALTPEGIATVFQTLTQQIFGFNVPSADPVVYGPANYAVRCGWQQTGQPAFKIAEDTAIITAYPLDEPYSKARDQQFTTNTSSSLNLGMSYTQVWRMHWTLYGPNAWDHARLIVSAMSLDWVHTFLQNPPKVASQIYAIALWDRPKYVPELFQGRWWQRTDLDLRFNELVNEVSTTPSAAGVGITINTNTGQVETVNIEA